MKLYYQYFLMHLKSQMQYKTSFFFTSLGQFLTSFSMFLGIYFMFDRFHQIEGFSFEEVLLCFSIVLFSFSFSECFFRGFDGFRSTIANGQFDRIMVQPRHEIIGVLNSKIELSKIGRFIQATIMITYAIMNIDMHWSIDKILLLLLMIISGFVVFSSLFLIYASFCFFTTESLEFMNIFTDGGREFGRYPFSIYGQGILKFFTYIIPLALFQYYPLLYLLDKSNNILYFITPILACLFFIPSYLFWRYGLKHYKSIGS